MGAPINCDLSRGRVTAQYATLQVKPVAAAAALLQLSENAVRLCEAYVSPACLAVMSADACVSQMVDSLRAPQQPVGLASATAVAIAVPLVVGECLVAICIGTGTQLAGPPVAGLQTLQVLANFISAGESGNQAQCTQTSCKHRVLL